MTLFGTRCQGTVIRELSPEVVLCIDRIVSKFYGRCIAVSMDASDFADMLRSTLAAGIMASDSDVVDLGVPPTLMLQYYVRSHGDVTSDMAITASHNSLEHNGFKFIMKDGMEVVH